MPITADLSFQYTLTADAEIKPRRLVLIIPLSADPITTPVTTTTRAQINIEDGTSLDALLASLNDSFGGLSQGGPVSPKEPSA